MSGGVYCSFEGEGGMPASAGITSFSPNNSSRIEYNI